MSESVRDALRKRVISRDEIDRLVEILRQTIDPVDLGWIAGVVDGEGTITISPRSRTDNTCVNNGWQVSVRVANTDKRMIDKLDALTRLISGSAGYVQEKRPNRCKRQYYWMVAARKALIFLKLIEPYLVVKREQARIAIEMQERMTSFTGIYIVDRDSRGRVKRTQMLPEEVEYRQKLYERIKELNRRGPSQDGEEGAA